METVIIPEKIAKKLYCRRCDRHWAYTGKSELFASCPRCRNTVTIQPKRKRGDRNGSGL
jgi:hypothetical protein